MLSAVTLTDFDFFLSVETGLSAVLRHQKAVRFHFGKDCKARRNSLLLSSGAQNSFGPKKRMSDSIKTEPTTIWFIPEYDFHVISPSVATDI